MASAVAARATPDHYHIKRARLAFSALLQVETAVQSAKAGQNCDGVACWWRLLPEPSEAADLCR
eukprot:scaffold145884_cov37-Tisochrysis_lutea.AAC.2